MTEELIERITIDPSICHGKPCVRGLRYPVETLLELLASGMTNEEILADYEDLTHEDILACLAYASRDVLDGSVGSLKSSPNFNEDPVVMQRKLRDEWS